MIKGSTSMETIQMSDIINAQYVAFQNTMSNMFMFQCTHSDLVHSLELICHNKQQLTHIQCNQNNLKLNKMTIATCMMCTSSVALHITYHPFIMGIFWVSPMPEQNPFAELCKTYQITVSPQATQSSHHSYWDHICEQHRVNGLIDKVSLYSCIFCIIK